jgi:hypothetical protein
MDPQPSNRIPDERLAQARRRAGAQARRRIIADLDHGSKNSE